MFFCEEEKSKANNNYEEKKVYQYMKYKCSLLPHVLLSFLPVWYSSSTYQRYAMRKQKENTRSIKGIRRRESGKRRKKEVQEKKGQNTHYIMHTQYLARKNH